MSRLYYPSERVPRGANAASTGTTPREAGEKVAKIVPAEIITGYLGLISLCQILKPEEGRNLAIWASFSLCLILTPFYFNMNAEKGKPKVVHITVSTLAFVVWAYWVSGDRVFAHFNATYAALIAAGFTLVSGLVPFKR